MMEGFELCFPQLNSSCRKPKRSLSDTWLTYILLSSISLLTVTLNLLVIISISHFKHLQTPTNLLLLSLAVSDFCVGFLVFVQNVMINGCWLFGDIICLLYGVFDYLITSASIGNMVLISIDRYMAICDPLLYPTKVTVKRVRICVSLCWICALFILIVQMKDNLNQPGRYKSCVGECAIAFNYNQYIVDLILTFIIPIAVITVLYLRVFVVAVSQARVMRSHVTRQCSVKDTAKKSEIKAARTLGVVIVVFLICLCPYFCFSLTGQDILNTSYSAFVICLFYFNSCLNPIIYAFFYPWFRKSIKLIVTLQILKPGSCETNILWRD